MLQKSQKLQKLRFVGPYFPAVFDIYFFPRREMFPQEAVVVHKVDDDWMTVGLAENAAQILNEIFFDVRCENQTIQTFVVKSNAYFAGRPNEDGAIFFK